MQSLPKSLQTGTQKEKMNKAYYKKAKHATPESHNQAINRLKQILDIAYTHVIETPKFTIKTEIGKRTYEPDLLVETTYYSTKLKPQTILFIVEADGKSHSGEGYQSRGWKDRVRDEAFKLVGMPTVRFEVEEVIGNYSLTTAEVIQRIFDNGIKPQLQS